MARSPLLPLQKAMFSRLNLALPEPVFSSTPDAEPYPYVVIGDDELNEPLTADAKVFETEINVDVYSDNDGLSQVKSICDSVQQQLTGSALDLSADNWELQILIHENTGYDTEVRKDSVRVRHGNMLFRAIAQDLT